MNYQFTIQVNETHIKNAVQKFFWATIGKAVPAMLVLAAVAIALAVFGREFGWLSGALVGIWVFCTILFFFLYNVLLQKRLALFKRYGGAAQYEFSEDYFKSKSGWASLETKWESFQAVFVSPKIWMLNSAQIGYFVFPIEQISNDIKDFLKRKIISVGGKVK